jgi:glucose/arabinose dehydrogenase
MRRSGRAGMAAAVILSMPGSGALMQAKTGDPVTASLFATGLNDPRGLTFGPDGRLYVAEGQSPSCRRARQTNRSGGFR